MVTLVVGITGVIRSGKSSLTTELADRLGAEARSFGAIVRDEAVRRGRGDSRLDQQTTGLELIAEGWTSFVDLLLTPRLLADRLVVDGIRHVEAFEELRRRFPEATFLLVAVDPTGAVIEERIRERGEDVASLAHAVEREIPEVQQRADVAVGGLDVEADCQVVLRRLGVA